MFDYILYLIGFNPSYYICEYETYEDEKEEKKEIQEEKKVIKEKTVINNYDNVIKELKLKLIQRNYHNK